MPLTTSHLWQCFIALSAVLIALFTANNVQADIKNVDLPSSSGKNRACVVISDKKPGISSDDAHAFLTALSDCNHGGHVVLKDTTYRFAQPVEALDLVDVDIELNGTIKFENDFEYWQRTAPKIYQHANLSYIRIGGRNVSIYGDGTIDGDGQPFYDAFAHQLRVSKLQRPHMITLDKLHGGRLAGIHLIASPQRFVVIENSTDITLESLTIRSENGSSNAAANTDGLNMHRSDSISFFNSTVINGDDCVAVKANSTNILVENIQCHTLPGGSGGLSIGSLGQHAKVYEFVENVTFRDCNVTGSQAAARIKTFPNGTLELEESPYFGGDGHGYIRNVTWQDINVTNSDLAVFIDQCYGMNGTLAAHSECPSLGSQVAIDGAHFHNVFGTVNATAWIIYAGAIQCSHAIPCESITFRNFSVVSRRNIKNNFACANIDNKTSQLGELDCITEYADPAGLPDPGSGDPADEKTYSFV